MSDTYVGRQDSTTAGTDIHAFSFLVNQLIALISTATLVKVVKNTNTPGQVAPIGNVDVLPLVNQLDGQGNAVPHVTVHGLPYSRLAGGSNAILMDPEPGDLGLVVFADRDISSVLNTNPQGSASGSAQANPGSRRRHDMQDGMFIHMARGPKPTQYIAFTDTGITIVDKNGNKIEMGPNGIICTSVLLSNTGEITAGAGGSDSVTLQQHTHDGVTPGAGDTSPPNPGT